MAGMSGMGQGMDQGPVQDPCGDQCCVSAPEMTASAPVMGSMDVLGGQMGPLR